MSKNRKTRKQKEKTEQRRNTQQKSIMDKMSDSHNDNIDDPAPKEQILIKKVSPTAGIVFDDNFIKKDLISILILAIFFSILIAILYYLDSNYNILHNVSNNLISYLIS